jgi:dinuclear metal center YbgI/SA1388 family protein
MARLSDVIGVLDELYDPRWADSWDRVGLVCGSPDAPVGRVLFAIDPTLEVVEEAITYDAQLLVVHHPLLLTPVSSVAATTPKGHVVHELLKHDIALLTAHTNADTPAYGVNEALAHAVGIEHPRILLPTDETGLDKLVTFVPHDAADAVREAITQAGAGQIGDYDSCTFTTTGEGRFRPLEGAHPSIGSIGSVEVVPESRIEAVYPRARRGQVVEALLAAHPYEEPAYDVIELGAGSATPTRGHGRIGELAEPMSLRQFGERVFGSLPKTAHGVRVAGDPAREIRTVAVGAGAGDSLLDLVARSGADVFVTSDLRHHRAGEFLESGGGALVDVAHWAAEWTWLPVAEERVLAGLKERGDTVDTRVSTVVTDPWTFRADPPAFR